MDDKIKRSPLFYVGDKYKLIKEIRQYFPKNINNFIEPFVGGGSVFLNIKANKYLLNDVDKNIYKLHEFLDSQKDINSFLAKVLKITKKYNLSKSFTQDIVPLELKQKYKKTYYAKFNKTGYENIRKDFNNANKKDFLVLYILLIYGFNRILRFNSKNEFNLPVGNVDFNKNVVSALTNYFDFTSKNIIELSNLDFKNFLEKISFEKDDFVYLDPPYLISFSEYNKIWNEEKELELLNFLDELNKQNIKFAISNITAYKGRKNEIFINWMRKYNFKNIKSNYISYHDNSQKETNEVLVFNY
ncbi:MAG: Dam family site-specific DNA-(adenine-N6)-methyltransferase [Candidatus Gracilibacteria bacterium]|nr:Dam family site-specific DNA-(adenine-N6)-methyltransferase [Candidatus Gracilibacteria bacterium]